MTFATLPDRRAAEQPTASALIADGVELDNATFLDRVLGAADVLRGRGVGPGDVVAAMLPNSVDFVVLMFAVWRLGATMTPINPAFTERETTRQLEDCAAKALVVADPMSHGTSVTVVVVDELTPTAHNVEQPVVDQTALALLIYTSGTTGTPKGVMLDHANINAMVEMGRAGLRLTAADRCLLVLPLFHVNGIIISVLTPLLAGGSVVIERRFDPSNFFPTVFEHRITVFSAVPTIFAILADLPTDLVVDVSSVRLAVCGAAPAPPGLLSRFESRFGFPVLEGYGLSEGTCGSTLNPVDGPRKPGTAGIPLAGQEIKIVDAAHMVVPPGEVGEIIVRGPNIMRGYLGRPDATRDALVGGWLHTGDLGVLDTDGYLTVVGRTKDMIIRGGENIYPKEIEDVLTEHPQVTAAAAIGVPDPKWGELVVAFVEITDAHDVRSGELDALCARELSPFKRPVDIVVVAALPLNAVGKIDKRALLDRFTSQR
ncbi:class I adenylate-forming enzyme family protein [Gordonia terrae]|uniref:AMP-dependent synthetase n=2 Tax=Gordonia terrae TaxID=2055 RepID=A0AAD0KBH7_9ACTN|nr:AMP-binding protein [Gordonia terrae]VTR09539.1 acyl-CoA synthetase (AMP-forming)/AMP-acid ligase II [Clostridioides difficile]ANY22161.1 AMP-dependent synthetase [Gordonia terrae]AWO82901.1 AMP-dependent synthetase [Gordonia terrae]VTS28757.1 Long-chain-fatty-acid--CoA ligase [Gordonia terrae]GAB46387.1 putative fatty-acid--CoA ligase [Gordonia terrae NBRC 100016]